MHIVLAVLSGLAAVFWVIYRLDREGFDFASLNPFLWKRRANWKQKLERDAIYLLETPLEVASLLMVAIAKETGEISMEEKLVIKGLMVSDLKRSQEESEKYFSVSSHFLQKHETIVGKVAKIIEPVKDQFTTEQTSSIDELLTSIASVAGCPSAPQQAVLSEFREAVGGKPKQESW